MWEFLDKVIYINLDHREDRREMMKKLFDDAQIPEEKVIRFSAIKHKYGIIGTALSHIGVLKLAKEEGYKRILILEDDLEWVNGFQENYAKLEELVSNNTWDVCMLAGLYLKTTPPKINMALWTNAYMTQSHYYDSLINNYERGVYFKLNQKIPPTSIVMKKRILHNMICEDSYHNIDTYWVKLQAKDNWIGVIPKMLKQRASWSDLNGKYEDHENTPFNLDNSYTIFSKILSMP
jgi:glycosyl transferase family 25